MQKRVSIPVTYNTNIVNLIEFCEIGWVVFFKRIILLINRQTDADEKIHMIYVYNLW